MKYLFLLTVTISVMASSCCKKKQVLPTIRIEYPKLEVGTQVVISRYLTNDSLTAMETVNIVKESDPTIFTVGLYSQYLCYVVDVFSIAVDSFSVDSSLIYTDTISDVSFELKGRCSNKLKDLSYKHNGTSKTEQIIKK